MFATEIPGLAPVAGLRLSDATMRQRDGRSVEREGALRPTVARAMVRLAGAAEGTLLDPCAGAGTILAEARAVGWSVQGRDIDPGAVAAARANVPDAAVHLGDARKLDLPDGTVAAEINPGNRTARKSTCGIASADSCL